MTRQHSRARAFAFPALAALLGSVLAVAPGGGAEAAASPRGGGAGKESKETSPAEKLGWRLGAQAWSFNRFSFFEAVDKTASAGMKYIEAYPGQRVGGKLGGGMGPGLNPEQRKEVKAKLDEAGVKLVCFGVTGAGNESGWRNLFEFAKDMGIESITSEPDPSQLKMIDRLCNEYGVSVAIHNHPKPSRYWNPDTVLEVTEGLSKRVGACADTGHWNRSGLVPLECLKKLEGRIVSLHFKDLNRKGGGHDVPWGTGVCDVRAMLAEIRRQKFKGVFSIEYEHNWNNSLPEIKQCVEFFNLVAGEIYEATREREPKKTSPRDRTPAARKADPKAASEAEADKLFRVARQAERMGQRGASASLYKKIVEKHPGTKAAERAAERLKALGM